MCQPADLPKLIAEEEAAQAAAIGAGFLALLKRDPAYDLEDPRERAAALALYAVGFVDGADWEAARRRELGAE